jgi:signal transduction histidine kinase
MIPTTHMKSRANSSAAGRPERSGRGPASRRPRRSDAGADRRLAALGNLAAGMSHEILNPVNTISLACQYLEALLTRRGAIPEETVREHFRMIHLELGRIRKILDDCARFRRAPVDRVELVDLGELVRATVDAFATASPGVSIDTTGAAPASGLRVPMDAAAMREALVHVLRNAAQSMPAGGAVRVEARPSGRFALLEVVDAGPGIPAAEKRLVFEPYYTTRPRALGIGLTLVRSIVRAHGGTVTLRSRPGKGTRVTIRLPNGERAPITGASG